MYRRVLGSPTEAAVGNAVCDDVSEHLVATPNYPCGSKVKKMVCGVEPVKRRRVPRQNRLRARFVEFAKLVSLV
jgi:hypothetical protein